MSENPNNHETALTRRIRHEIEARGWTVRELERQAGLKENGVLSILKGRSLNPRIDTIQKIALAFDCTVGDLLGETAGNSQTDSTRQEVNRRIYDILFFNLCMMADSGETQMDVRAIEDAATGLTQTIMENAFNHATKLPPQKELNQRVSNVIDLFHARQRRNG